jgi:putative peptidoglycan lipid II flippase
MLALHGRLGIRSAAVGVAAGSVLMVAIQVPALVRRLGTRGPRLPVAASITLAAVAPVAVFTVVRQAQVLIERYVGSSLAPGTISHLNYAQKVGQVPMTLALVLTAVTFPALARTMAAGDENGSLRRVHADLRTVSTVVLLASAYLWACAPQAIALLFQHGEYTAADTAATAAILRIYLLGLLGHAFVGVLSRPFFSGERPTWFPAAAMVGGLVVNAILAVLLAGPYGARGIAAANAAGILLAALLLLVGARRSVPGLVTGAVLVEAGRLVVPAAAAAGIGLLATRLVPGAPDLAVAALGALVVPAAFAAVAAITVPAGVRAVAALVTGVPARSRP